MDGPSPFVLVNGYRRSPAEGAISVFDRGFQYGDGLFETLAVVGGRVRDLEAHLERLAQGARVLGIPEPDREALSRELAEAGAGLGPEQRGVLKVLYSRGPGGRGLAPPETPEPTRVVLRLPWPEHPPGWAREGVRVIHCRTRQVCGAALDGRIKHMNQLNHIVARMEWTDPGIAEGLLRDGSDRVIEGTVTNLFRVAGGAVETPRLDGSGLAGITRWRILELAAEAGLETREVDLRARDLRVADEVFLTSSLIGVWPVRELDGEALRGAPGPVTRELQAALERFYA